RSLDGEPDVRGAGLADRVSGQPDGHDHSILPLAGAGPAHGALARNVLTRRASAEDSDMIRQIKAGQTAATKAENTQQVRQTVEGILGDIAARGEAAVREYSVRFDKWSPESFRVSAQEIDAAISSLPQQTIRDIEFAQTQIRNFAQIQRAALKDVEVETLPGV